MKWHVGLPDSWGEIPRYPPLCIDVSTIEGERLDSGTLIRWEENEDAYVYADSAVDLDQCC